MLGSLKDSIWASQATTSGSEARGNLGQGYRVTSSHNTSWNTAASKPTQTASSKPETGSTMAPAAAHPESRALPRHLRGQQVSYVPPHLRGIDPVTHEAPKMSPTQDLEDFSSSASSSPKLNPKHVSKPAGNHEVVLTGELGAKTPNKQTNALLESVLKPSTNPNAAGEEWARKMGLLKPKPSTNSNTANQTTASPSTANPKVADATAPILNAYNQTAASPDTVTPNVTNPKVANTTAPNFRAANPTTENEEWARKMGLLPKSAPSQQAAKTQNGLSSPDPQKKSSGPSAAAPSRTTQQAPHAFNNKHFHLREDSTENFYQYVQKSSATNGKKYTQKASESPSHQPQNGHPTIDNSHRPSVFASQQQDDLASQATRWEQQSSQYGMLSSGLKVENRAPSGYHEAESKFPLSQSQQSNTNPDADKRTKRAHVKAGLWPSPFHMEQSASQQVAAELSHHQYAVPNAAALTQDALVKTTGFKPRSHEDDFEEKVSDAGVVQSNREGIRATQGVDAATQLLDWDGKTWAPPPCDWEYERPGFDDSFVPAYIKEWQIGLPCGPSVTAWKDELLDRGIHPINNGIPEAPIEQPDSQPDIVNCVNEVKRTTQTAFSEAQKMLSKVQKKRRQEERQSRMLEIQHRQYNADLNANTMGMDCPDPFAAKIEMYVRPAQPKDAEGIMKIYNHYIANSIMPEDQEPVSIYDAQCLIDGNKKEKLPFVVAIKGRLPGSFDAQRRPRSAKVCLPQVESVIGFAFAERFNYAFSGSVKGRSRGTASLQLYVHPEHTRKGVGQNTLDQLLHCMAGTAYSYNNSVDWVNPEKDPVHEPDGCGPIHQLVMQIPVVRKPKNLNENPDYVWLEQFLHNKFFFNKEAILPACARTSIKSNYGNPAMLDLVIFQKELLHEDAFTFRD